MWSEAARASSLLARSGGSGGVAVAPAGGGNVAAQGAGLQAGLARAGASSRGQWGSQRKGKRRSPGPGDSPAHQSGVNAVVRNMRQAESQGQYPATNYLY